MSRVEDENENVNEGFGEREIGLLEGWRAGIYTYSYTRSASTRVTEQSPPILEGGKHRTLVK